MKKYVLVAVAVMMTLGASAQQSKTKKAKKGIMVAQNTTTQTLPEESAQSTTSVSTAKPEAASKWSGSITAIANRSGVLSDHHFTDGTGKAGSDGYSAYSSVLDTEYHFKVGYKLSNGDKVQFNQRVYYSIPTQDSQVNASMVSALSFASLRAEYVKKLAIGSDSSILARLGIPTTYNSYLDGSPFNVAAILSLNYELTPKWGLGVTSYNGTNIYTAKARGLANIYQDAIYHGYSNDYSASQATGYLNAQPFDRNWVYFDNSATISYNFTDKVSLSQSGGYAFGLKNMNNNFSNFKRVTALWNIGTELDFQATKDLGLSVAVAQAVADMEGASDLSTSKGIYNSNFQFALYRAEETTYTVSANYKF